MLFQIIGTVERAKKAKSDYETSTQKDAEAINDMTDDFIDNLKNEEENIETE